MDEATKKEFKDYIFTAVQAGKLETSNLVDSILHKMEPAIEKGIEKYVNGHLREIKAHLERQDGEIATQNNSLGKIQEEQTKVRANLEAMQTATNPLIDSRRTVINVGRFVIWIGAISGASAAIIWLLDKLANTK